MMEGRDKHESLPINTHRSFHKEMSFVEVRKFPGLICGLHNFILVPMCIVPIWTALDNTDIRVSQL